VQRSRKNARPLVVNFERRATPRHRLLKNIFVRNGGGQNEDHLGRYCARTWLCHIVGDRPGLATAESLSAYGLSAFGIKSSEPDRTCGRGRNDFRTYIGRRTLANGRSARGGIAALIGKRSCIAVERAALASKPRSSDFSTLACETGENIPNSYVRSRRSNESVICAFYEAFGVSNSERMEFGVAAASAHHL